MKLRRFLSILLAFLSLGGCTPSSESLPERLLTVDLKNGLERAVSVSELQGLLPVNDISLEDPHDQVERSYRGFPLTELLTAVYGPRWQQADEVIFVCLDGYEASVPVSLLKNEPAHLAVGFTDGSPFGIFHRGQDIDFGPFYLVWDKGAKPEHSSYTWPYQVYRLRLAQSQERQEAAAPPEGSSESALRGYQAFGTYCQTCHSINGHGGTFSVDLAYPVKVTDYWDEGYLRQLIDDPASVRANAKMPALRAEVPNRDQVLDDLVSYLKSVESRSDQKSSERVESKTSP